MRGTLRRLPIVSSDLSSVGYDPDTRQMEVEFRRGTKLYTYENVPPEIYQGLMNAISPGKYFYANIRDKYTYTAREMKS